MIIMAFDMGEARTGVAVCDKTELLASPVCVIEEGWLPKLVQKAAEQAKLLSAQMIVVGLPKNMDGSVGERARRCTEFADALREATGLETDLYDERLTTVSAHNVLNEVNVRGKKRKKTVDAVAATIILQAYIDKRRTVH